MTVTDAWSKAGNSYLVLQTWLKDCDWVLLAREGDPVLLTIGLLNCLLNSCVYAHILLLLSA